VVELDGEDGTLRLTDTRSGEVADDVTGDELALSLAETAAVALAPVVDVSAAQGRGRLPRQVSLVELLGLEDVSSSAVAARWRSFSGRRSALLGAAAESPFEIDLVGDGPHALIGGTTGSGKSELLQTFVTSLAATVPPDRLNFLLVDYKGGAAFKECVALPHTVGFVTDLDAHLTNRARISLDAELKRREGVLRAAGAKDLPEMERRDPDGAPPSLVIVIDEFATLSKEIPEFVDGVVDVAQRGRTLGLHLVLATQRPRGAITDNIRANTTLRMAMRMASRPTCSSSSTPPPTLRPSCASRPSALPGSLPFPSSSPSLRLRQTPRNRVPCWGSWTSPRSSGSASSRSIRSATAACSSTEPRRAARRPCCGLWPSRSRPRRHLTSCTSTGSTSRRVDSTRSSPSRTAAP
jgi:S-DNA-T family DNA segregation ATPase FtsK/SpoIIIE